MTLREFIRQNREELTAAIRSVCPGGPMNDGERRLWVLNDEGLYNWARRSGVALLLALTLAAPALAAQPASEVLDGIAARHQNAPQAPRVKPATSITVKVYTDAKHKPKVDLTAAGCVAWVSSPMEGPMRAGFDACLSAVWKRDRAKLEKIGK